MGFIMQPTRAMNNNVDVHVQHNAMRAVYLFHWLLGVLLRKYVTILSVCYVYSTVCEVFN